jgi:hypothetical protein
MIEIALIRLVISIIVFQLIIFACWRILKVSKERIIRIIAVTLFTIGVGGVVTSALFYHVTLNTLSGVYIAGVRVEMYFVGADFLEVIPLITLCLGLSGLLPDKYQHKYCLVIRKLFPREQLNETN